MAGAPITMGLREANQKFSQAIRSVRAGRSVIITDRGKPVAVIQPIEPEEEDEGRARLIAAGLLRPAYKKGPLPPFRPVKLRGKPIEDSIREERDAE